MMIGIDEIYIKLHTVADHDDFEKVLKSINHNVIRNGRYKPKIKSILETLQKLFVKYGYIDESTLKINIHRHITLIIIAFSYSLDNFEKIAKQVDQDYVHCHYMEVLHYINMPDPNKPDPEYWKNLIAEWQDLEDILLTSPIEKDVGILMAIESDEEFEIFRALYDYVNPQSAHDISRIFEYTIKHNFNNCFRYALYMSKTQPQDLYKTCIKYDNFQALKICMAYIPDIQICDQYKQLGKISINPDMQKFFGAEIKEEPVTNDKLQIEQLTQSNANLLQQIQEMSNNYKQLEVETTKARRFKYWFERMMIHFEDKNICISGCGDGWIACEADPSSQSTNEIKQLTDQLKSFISVANYKETKELIEKLETELQQTKTNLDCSYSENDKLHTKIHKLETQLESYRTKLTNLSNLFN